MKIFSMRLLFCVLMTIRLGGPGSVHAASTGANWTQATASAAFPSRASAQAVSFQNKMFLIGGYNAHFLSDVWTSSNGKDWTQVTVTKPFPARMGHVCLVYNNKIYLMGGSTGTGQHFNDVWSTPDGKEWTCLTANCSVLQNRFGKFATVFKNKIWLVGGTQDSKLNKVYSSTNGTSWTLEQDAPAFKPLAGATCIVFNNKLWLIGGATGGGGFFNYYADVWNSPDGKTWTQTNPTHIFSPRCAGTSCVFDNKLWVIGGVGVAGGRTDYINDVWYTVDGSDWIQATANADYGIRRSAAGVVFDNKMWMIGGQDSHSYMRNDVWYSSIIKNSVPPGAWLGY